MVMAIITGVVVAGATGNPLIGILAGVGWMLVVGLMDNGRRV